jgi:hypothetical protein
MPGGVSEINFADIFLRAMQVGQAGAHRRSLERRAALEQQQQKIKLDELRAARDAFAAGEPGPLQRIAPTEAIALRRQTQAERGFAQEQQAEKERRTAIFAQGLQQIPVESPEFRQRLQFGQELARRGRISGIGLPAAPEVGPIDIPQAQQAVGEALAIAELPTPPRPDQSFAARVRRAFPDDPVKQGALIRQRLEKEAEGPRGVQVNIGDAALGLTRAQTGKQQGEILGADLQLRQLVSIRQSIQQAGGAEELTNLFAGLKAQGAGFATRLSSGLVSPEERQRLGARGAAIADLGALTNTIISKLGGANVPPAEFKRLTESLPRPDDPPDVLMSKLERWEKNLQVVRDHGIDALIKGVRRDEPRAGADSKAEIQRLLNAGDRTAAADMVRRMKNQGRL